MANKRKGSLAVTCSWNKHLRPFLKRVMAKKERMAGRVEIKKETE